MALELHGRFIHCTDVVFLVVFTHLVIGEFLVRRGAKRSARAILKEAIAAWTGISAIGKAKHLAEKHEWLLKTAAASRYIDNTTQTLDTLVNISQNSAIEPPLVQQHLEDDRKKNWVENHGVAVPDGPLDIPSVGLGTFSNRMALSMTNLIVRYYRFVKHPRVQSSHVFGAPNR